MQLYVDSWQDQTDDGALQHLLCEQLVRRYWPAYGASRFLSVAMHEIGHSFGFEGHFSGSTNCPNTNFDATMCDTYDPYETHYRTLRPADITEAEDAY